MKKLKPAVEQQIQSAQLHLVERALIAFLEDIENRVPSDAEILEHGFHAKFSDTPLSVFVKEEKRFTQFYVWRKQHVVALGFLNPDDPLELSIVRVPRENWPGVLCAFVAQYKSTEGGENASSS